jgi:hypothetical protein
MGFSAARIKAIEQALSRKHIIDVSINYESYEITFHCDNKRKYIPSATAKEFHAGDSEVKTVMGPYGSGKTTFACMDLLIRACKMPRSYDGIRRCRTLIFRNTFDQLKKGVYDTWTQWFANLGQTKFLKGNQLEFHHYFNDGDGFVEWEIWFVPMEKITDPSKFKSFNATNALLNELSELPRTVLDHLPSRLGRYPLKDEIDPFAIEEKYKKPIVLSDGTKIERCPYWNGILADTNPPDTRHYVYKTFEKERPKGFKIFKQPPGLIEQEDGSYLPNPNCDNYGIGIGQDYYLKQVSGHTKEYIQVYCMGRYGIYVPGKAVYPQYNDDIHSQERIEFDSSCPVLIALDGGFTPAALFCQMVGGQLRAIREFTTDRMYLEEFVEFVVKPFVASNLRDYKFEVTGDPAITQREDEALRNLGFVLNKAITNKIEPRVQAQAQFLNRNVGGQPCFIVSREGCPELRAGFIGEYNFKEIKKINPKTGNPEHAEEPDKTHPTSDIHDCAQYVSLHFTQNELMLHGKLDGRKFISTERF